MSMIPFLSPLFSDPTQLLTYKKGKKMATEGASVHISGTADSTSAVSSATVSAESSAATASSSALSKVDLKGWAKELGIGSPKTVDLFGGALSCDIPANFVDLSRFRDVPDNQEVWNDPAQRPHSHRRTVGMAVRV